MELLVFNRLWDSISGKGIISINPFPETEVLVLFLKPNSKTYKKPIIPLLLLLFSYVPFKGGPTCLLIDCLFIAYSLHAARTVRFACRSLRWLQPALLWRSAFSSRRPVDTVVRWPPSSGQATSGHRRPIFVVARHPPIRLFTTLIRHCTLYAANSK